jgi:hypothetical protein
MLYFYYENLYNYVAAVNIHVQYIILYIIWKYNEENFNDIIIVSQYLSEKMIVIQYFFVASFNITWHYSS